LGFKTRLLLYLKAPLLQQQLLGFISALANVSQPVFLQKLLAWLSDRSTGNLDDAIFYAFCMTGLNLVNTLCYNRALLVGRQMSVQLRAVLNGELFTKTLRRQDLSHTGEEDSAATTSTSGKISNLVSSDVLKIAEYALLL
jgi:ABC-type transport system involved in cytochrome bd biosynthesis fused ATPase/permease subunit